uniref:Uncharacterized protein n=1 Tax=Gopherus agassizii TaxID=38772 RepID=A0A452HS30_9SAUR
SCSTVSSQHGAGRPGSQVHLHRTREVLPLQPPHCFVLLSLFSTFFCNVCCLGFTALVFSFKARDRKVLGDTDGAGSNGKTAKCLNIAVLVLGCSVVLVFIILLSVKLHRSSVRGEDQGLLYLNHPSGFSPAG